MKFLNDLNINENSLKNGRFEEVSSLPSTNLFVGRQVVYNNKIKMIYGKYNIKSKE